MDFYASIAAYYDYIFPLEEKQVGFISKNLDVAIHKSIIDIGCGTGNLAIALEKKGFKITGIDLKAEMIEKAQMKINGEMISFQRANMNRLLDYFPENAFDAGVCIGNTLVHLESLGQIERFLSQVFKILKPGGKLIAQIINYDKVLSENIDHLERIENDDVLFERFYEYDLEDFKIKFKTKLQIKKENNRLVENSVKIFPLRKKELQNLLDKTGFKNVSYYDNFSGDEYTGNNMHMIFVAEL